VEHVCASDRVGHLVAILADLLSRTRHIFGRSSICDSAIADDGVACTVLRHGSRACARAHARQGGVDPAFHLQFDRTWAGTADRWLGQRSAASDCWQRFASVRINGGCGRYVVVRLVSFYGFEATVGRARSGFRSLWLIQLSVVAGTFVLRVMLIHAMRSLSTGSVCSLRGDGFDYLGKDQVVESPATTWLRRFAGRRGVN
jgi:hypothetical protein